MREKLEDELYPGLVYNNKLIAVLIVISTALFLAVWLAPVQYSHYQVKYFVAWHTLAECFSIALSVSIFTIMWQAHVADETRLRLNIVSVSFLAVAVLDAAHMLTFKDMPDWIVRTGHGNSIPFWFFARYAATFALIALVSPGRPKLKFSIQLKMLFVVGVIYITIPFVLVIADPRYGNLFIIPGRGLTNLKIGIEWGVIALLVLALLINNYTKRNARFYDTGAIILAIHLSILSELCFTLYSNVSGVFSVLGHIYKIGSYVFLYQGIAVTSLKLPFKQLAKNEELLLQITTNIRQIFLVSSVNRNAIYYVSPAFHEITGKNHLSLLNKPSLWFEIIHPEDRQAVRESLHIHAGEEFSHEFRMKDANGEMMYMLENVYPIFDSKNNVTRIASVCENITNRKILQQALSGNERMLANMINSLPVLIGYWGKDLRNIFANDTYARWFNKTSENIKGIRLDELLGDELFEKNKPYIDAVLKGEPQEFERDLINNRGEKRRGLLNYVPDVKNSEVFGFFATVLDITGIVKTHAELSRSEDRLLRSQSLGHIGSWEVDLQTGDAWWSQENYHVYGLEKGTPIDMHTALDLVHPEDRDDLLAVWDSSLKNQSTYSHEHRIVTPNNEIKYVWEFAEISYDDEQNPRMLAGCTQDITERKNAEFDRTSLQNQLMQTQKMESIGHLAGGVAHDFNNMLGAMLGYTELLKQTVFSREVEKERISKYIAEIMTAGNRAKELVSQMLVFSRNSPETQAEAPIIQLQPVINEVVNLLRSSIPATITINCNTNESAIYAQIHPVQLHQILLNLAINARDSIQEYGSIEITINEVAQSGYCHSCHNEYSGEYLDITVKDNGDGIEKELLGKIFDPFYTTKAVGKGTGMGLSVVHGVVHSMGGHIYVLSEIDRGSEFHVLLPITKHLSGAQVFESKLKRSENGRKLLYGMVVMVVDDEQAITSFLADLLMLHGARVKCFNHSPDALAEFLAEPDAFDLIITDETMPELSGTDMSVTMLKKRSTLKIILCTGYSNKVTREIALKKGISGFMLKPIKANELLEEIVHIKKL